MIRFEKLYDLVKSARGRLLEGHEIRANDWPRHYYLGFEDLTTGESFSMSLFTVKDRLFWRNEDWERIGLSFSIVNELLRSTKSRGVLFGVKEISEEHVSEARRERLLQEKKRTEQLRELAKKRKARLQEKA